MFRTSVIVASVAGLAFMLNTPPALAGAHSWRFTEVFSNADGSIQYIEMQECCGGEGEIYLNYIQVTSQVTGKIFTFPANLEPPSSYRHLLLATQSFADLPGAPAPDYIIQPQFFDRHGDTLFYGIYDAWEIAGGQVPVDCVNALSRDGSTAPNTPINYADQKGHVTSCATCVGDANNTHAVDIDDLVMVITHWNSAGAPGSVPGDVNSSGAVNIDDLVMIITHWGPCS